mgnify:FL=1
MICTVCSTENPDGAAFCMGCGKALQKSCASCGADLPPGAGFCPSCGAKVGDVAAAPAPAPSAPPDSSPSADDGLRRYVPAELLAKLEYAAQTGSMAGERRTITMLFCDLQGSTAAAEAMDPEEWAEVMNGAFEHLIAPVYRYEGTLARLMGDAVLAFFGAPIGHEDDPERAVRAGLEIIDAIEPYRARVKGEWGIDIDVRVGINTGLVVVGAMGSDLRVEYTAMGDAVNTAARMEQTAAPGTVQVAESTRNLVDRLFEFEDLGGIEVKGKTDPVPAYRVVKALPRPETLRGIEGLNAPLVGRDDELARLEAVIAAMTDGKGGIASVMAEAGLGKSRLVAEAKQHTTEVRWHEGRSLSYETATPYAPVRRILRSICGLRGGEAPAESWRKIEDTVAAAVPGRIGTVAPFLAWLLEVPVPENVEHRIEYLDPPQLRTEAFRATVELLEGLAGLEPIVIVFEDLHWADDASLDLVKELLALASRSTMVLVLILRPRRQEAAWELHEAAERDYPHIYTHIALNPLDEGETRELVANLLAIDGLPDRVRSEILARSEGNPFFLEEIIRSMMDRDLIVHDGKQWTATEEADKLQVPETISAVLTTRLDSLDERARHVAQAASVVGRQFRYDELAACLPDLTGLDDCLTELQRRQLVREVTRIPKRLFRFRHALLQEAAYETVLLKQRTQLHTAIADFLEGTQPERVEDLADHLLKGRQGKRAVPYLVAAGERAARSYAVPTAIDRLETALDLMDDTTDPGLLRRALETLGQAKQFAFDIEGAAAAYQRLREEGEMRADTEMKISGLNKGGLVRGFFFDERDAALDDIAHAEELARTVEDQSGLVESCVNQCFLRTGHGEFEQVEYYMSEVTRLGADLNDPDSVLFGMTHLSNTLVMLTRFDEALEEAEKTLAYAREHGNLHYQAEIQRWAIPICHLRNGDVAAATASLEEGMELAVQIGDRASEAFCAYLQGRIAMDRGYLQDALSLFRRSQAAADATGYPPSRALGACAIGTCYFTIGGALTEDALQLHEQALQLVDMPSGSALATPVWAEVGHCVLASGKVDDAKELFNRALTERTALINLSRPSALIGTIDVALLEGRQADAEQILTELEQYVAGRDMTDWQPAVLFTAAAVAAGAGDHTTALLRLAECRDLALDASMRIMLLDVHAATARSLRARDRHDEVAAAEAAAREVAESVAADITDAELRATFLDGVEARLA